MGDSGLVVAVHRSPPVGGRDIFPMIMSPQPSPSSPPHRPPHGHKAAGTAYLVPISGPPMAPIELAAERGTAANGLVIGRHATCDLLLPADAEKVSRAHARFNFDQSSVPGQWRLTDLNSRWGTFLQGVRMKPAQQMPLSEGDMIRITPWTFSFTNQSHRGGLLASDDTGQTVVRTMAMLGQDTAGGPRSLRDEMLGLLLESAAAIHSADDERQLAELVMDAAIRGTGLSNAVMLRPLDAAGHFEVIASQVAGAPLGGGGGGGGGSAGLGGATGAAGATFSRTLINAAAQGQVAELSGVGMAGGPGLGTGDIGHSIVTMKISAALCVPLMLGGAPAAFLYLDSRGGGGGGGALAQTIRPGASAFCAALGRMASLALANLKRIDVERRQAQFDIELRAAAAAQRWIMPKRLTRAGAFECIGESRPGRYVGGDFFDVIDLGHDRVAVALGDVSGKGVAASVLMTATQGFLHAALTASISPLPGDDACGVAKACAHAVQSANRYVNPRKPEGKFVTLWVGVLDLRARTLCYVDAGHSYSLLHGAGDGSFVTLDAGEGLPLGVADDGQFEYTVETVALPAGGGAVLVVSDGIVEQPAAPGTGAGGAGAGGAGAGGAGAGQPEIDRYLMGRVRASLEASMKRHGEPTADSPTASASADAVADLFDAVIRHAGTDQLADDATAVLVRWS